MKYEQVERKMPFAMKERIVGQSWCASTEAQKKSLSELLTHAQSLSLLCDKLTMVERRTLRLIMSVFGCLSFTDERLEKEAAQLMAGAQVSLGLMGLRQYGVIISFRKAWGEQLYVLPEDAFSVWQSLLFPELRNQVLSGDQASQLELLEAGDVGDYTSTSGEQDERAVNPRGLAQQMFYFMLNCSRQPALSLTNKGTLPKKQVVKLTEYISLPNRILTMSGLTYAFADIYDEPAALLLEMGIQLGFLLKNEADNAYVMDQSAFQDWLQCSYDHQQAQVYQVWRQAILPGPVWLEHGIAYMEKASDGRWYELDALVRTIQACCCSPSEGCQSKGDALDVALQQQLVSTWMEPLSVFRFLELGKDECDQLWFRWLISPSLLHQLASLEEPREVLLPSFYVQPDYELLLPPGASLLTEWQIAAFADLQHADLVRTYRISKESFQRGLDSGMQGAQVISFMQKHAFYEVPLGVINSLQQWEEQKDKLYLENVSLLRCQSADIADALFRNEKCRHLLGERMSETSYIVSQDNVKFLTKCLASMGFHPNRSLAKKPAQDEEALLSPSKPAQGLCYSRDTVQLYEIDPHMPSRNDLYPDMQHIPTSWIQEFRDYHASTRKDIIRKAIEWRSVLQLRKEGRDCYIIPRRLREERSGWLLEGWEQSDEIAWPSDQWNEMKLILPGINDVDVLEKGETLREL